jgi:hypothetical protein
MNNRNQQTARVPAPAEATAPTYLNVFTVEEYESNGKTAKKWTRIGAAFPHKEGIGFSIELKAFPIDGRLVSYHPIPTTAAAATASSTTVASLGPLGAPFFCPATNAEIAIISALRAHLRRVAYFFSGACKSGMICPKAPRTDSRRPGKEITIRPLQRPGKQKRSTPSEPFLLSRSQGPLITLIMNAR